MELCLKAHLMGGWKAVSFSAVLSGSEKPASVIEI